MKLAASLIVRNEVRRYLPLVFDNLLGFCDALIVVDDASDDGTTEFLVDHPDPRVHVFVNQKTAFFEHEGRARQRLLVETLAHDPTWVLNVDGDELVSDGQLVREVLAAQPDVPVWSLLIEEVWRANLKQLFIREDSGWRTHPLNVLWKVPAKINDLRIMDRRLACRRVPTAVWQQVGKPMPSSVLHFGWVNKSERQHRYERYQRHDKGRFHASAHLRSIMLPDEKIKLRAREWPLGEAFDRLRTYLTAPLASATR